MKQYTYPGLYLLLFLWLMAACKKDGENLFSPDVAINQNIVRVADTATNTRILVHAKGNWTASMEDDELDWVQLRDFSGKGQGEFFADFESNEGNLPREASVLVKGGQKTDTIFLQQKGIPTTIEIVDTAIVGIAAGGKMKTGIRSNMSFDLLDLNIDFDQPDDTDWISDVAFEGQSSLIFNLAKSESTETRSALLRLSYLDAFGTLNQDSLIIRQKGKAGNESDDAVEQTFAYIKNTLSEGEVEENIYVEGIVISSKGNPNLATNLNKSISEIDPTENNITFYIQDPNGTDGGIMLKTKSGSDNIFDKDEKVKLWLKGAKLTKLDNPKRYLIEGIETDHILEKSEGTAVQPKEVYMKDLVDEDIYTFVKLKDVEISVPSGSFSNINEGYSKRMSVYPVSIRDIHRDNMYMLINLDVPYRRDGNRVPRGSGDITGILVHDNLPRYGGDIGKYSIRPLNREDIDLRENKDDGFTKVIAEWRGFKSGEKDPLAPDIGQEYGAKFSHSSSNVTAGPDFNGLTTTEHTIATGGYSATGWWNNGKGESWIVELSTLSINKPLSMQWEGDVIVGGPRNFTLEWSTDKSSGQWEYIAEFTLQDLVRPGANTLLTQVAGHKVVDFALPETLLGKNKVYIRARVTNNEAGTETSDVGGTIVAASACRLGHISIKQNK